jgi:HAD superfamily hydrolase (TIGR01509 family)
VAVHDFVSKPFSNEEAYARFGPTLEEMIAELVPKDELDRAIEVYHSHYQARFKSSARLYSGISELIRSLRGAGVQIAACTGSSQRMTETTLKESGLDATFAVVTSADDVRHAKPDPESIVLTMQRMRATPGSTISLGDSARDIEASRKAGIRSAAALWGFGEESQLLSLNPDFAFRTPVDLLPLFG